MHCRGRATGVRGWARSLVSLRLRGLVSVPRGSYARAYLEHKLVTCIAQQADAFGQGVRDVLPLLGSRDLDELKAAWARHAKLEPTAATTAAAAARLPPRSPPPTIACQLATPSCGAVD